MKNYQHFVDDLKGVIDSDDLLIRDFSACGKDFTICYIDGMSDKMLLQQTLIKPILDCEYLPKINLESLHNLLYTPESIKLENDINRVSDIISMGDMALFCSDSTDIFILTFKSFNTRSITEPPTESVIKGPREGFIEEIKTNISLLRRCINSPKLRVKMLNVGKYKQSHIAVVYINDIAKPELVDTIVSQLEKIDIDGTIDSTYVGSFLEPRKYSFFNQIGHIEKPDIVTGKLLEGRIAIICDGSPIVLTLPYIFIETFQDSYDYYTKSYRASMLRIIRVLSMLLTIYLPGLYVAIEDFHYHLLPLKFITTLLNAVKGIPLTPAMEMITVLILFEVLHQASIRMPRHLGVALSVVGAIVLGQTAVSAGILSSPAVLIIAMSAIGIHCLPDSIDLLSFLRLTFLIIGSILGLYGLILASMVILCYLANLENFGAPYLAPFAPIISPDIIQDGYLKSNLLDIKIRPKSIPHDNNQRQK